MARGCQMPWGFREGFSPHTRGWPVTMNPGLAVISRRSPRTRGDGPALGRIGIAVRDVLPAHAGMARHNSSSAQTAFMVLPAHAGMARTASSASTLAPEVLPAHAGMARSPPTTASPPPTVLPAHAGMARHSGRRACLHIAFSPHTRGWPADLHPGAALHRRSPRTRGDGPSEHPGTDPKLPSSPRTRGDGPQGKCGGSGC